MSNVNKLIFSTVNRYRITSLVRDTIYMFSLYSTCPNYGVKRSSTITLVTCRCLTQFSFISISYHNWIVGNTHIILVELFWLSLVKFHWCFDMMIPLSGLENIVRSNYWWTDANRQATITKADVSYVVLKREKTTSRTKIKLKNGKVTHEPMCNNTDLKFTPSNSFN